MYKLMGFTALITALVLCARSHDSVFQCQCVGHVSYSRLQDLWAEENRGLLVVSLGQVLPTAVFI